VIMEGLEGRIRKITKADQIGEDRESVFSIEIDEGIS